MRGGGLICAFSNNIGAQRDYKILNCYASGTVTVSSSSDALNVSGGGLIGEVWWTRNTDSASITNCAALGSTVLANGNNAYRGRIIGKMEIGADSGNKADVTDGELNNINGLNKNLTSDHAAILSVLNQGLTVPVWECKQGATLPSLK
jgi:hypothetical protein